MQLNFPTLQNFSFNFSCPYFQTVTVTGHLLGYTGHKLLGLYYRQSASLLDGQTFYILLNVGMEVVDKTTVDPIRIFGYDEEVT